MNYSNLSTNKKNNESIISFLNKKGLSKNVRFGDVIGKLNPKNLIDGKNHLTKNKYYFFKDLDFNKRQKNLGVAYLTNSFGKLFVSEKIALSGIKKYFGEEPQKAEFEFDKKYGVDFVLENKLFIVKTLHQFQGLESLAKNKRLASLNYQKGNIKNSFVYLILVNFKKQKLESVFKFFPKNNGIEIKNSVHPLNINLGKFSINSTNAP